LQRANSATLVRYAPSESNPATVNEPPQTIVATTVPAAGDLSADWELAVTSAVSVFLIGEGDVTTGVVDAMRPHLVDPIVNVDCHAGFDLSSVPSRGTVILSDVDALLLADQQCLNTWLVQADHRPRVISTSRTSMLPMIDAGMFIESLYYRLNVLRFDLTSTSRRTLIPQLLFVTAPPGSKRP
jgi:hypothetical protein